MDDQAIEWGGELSAFDYMMYRADADARSRTSMMYIETLDVVPDWHLLREEIDRVSRVALRLRQHVVAPLVPLTAARWVVDPDFDLDYHLRRFALPAPGDFPQLLDTAATMYASPLDPGRPLWEVTLVEGLDDRGARAALVWKMSHSITDGVGGMVLERIIRTDERHPRRDPLPPLPVPEDVSSMDLTRRAVRGLPIAVVRGLARRVTSALGGLGRAARDPGGALDDAAKVAGAVRKLGGATTEPSPLLRGRGLNRRFAALDVALADLRATAKAHGCSVNDAYVAALTGALRMYHESLGVPIDAIAMAMPINLRPATDTAAVDNQWTGVTFAAPVAETDPVRRMRAIRELVLTARGDAGINVVSLIAPVVAWLPQGLLPGGGSIGIDVQASNVPGHPLPRYVAGAKIVRAVPLGPVPGVAMMVTMVSLAGRCFVGVNYDTAAVTEPELLADCLQRGFDEVIAVGAAAPADTAREPAPRKATSSKATSSKATTTKATTSTATTRRPDSPEPGSDS